MDSSETNAKKNRGKIYTPAHIVKHILNLGEYCGKNILKKHVIDNSCGDGAFLIEVVERYIKEALLDKISPQEISADLETYIHGIEINKKEHSKCIENLNLTCKKYNLTDIKWDVICADATKITKYNNKMSFVVGNPPYVRVHNLGNNFEKIKGFNLTKSGMTDLFIVFYEIGLKMLNKNGILSYITPSSLFNSLACKDLRKYITDKKLLTKVVDLKHNQVFNATTYTAIMVLDNNNKNTNIKYFEYDITKNNVVFIDNLEYSDFYFAKNFYFGKKDELKQLKQIAEQKNDKSILEVKNGFATLDDEFFIGEFDFKNYVIPIIKASTGEEKQCLYPYKNACLLPYETLAKDRKIKEYYEENKTKLSKRSLEKKSKWYAFGRSQGINDVSKTKYAINSLVKDTNSIKLIKCPSGVGVYSGLYILTEIPENIIKDIIVNEKFIKYVKMLSKYKNGGYYTFSSSDLAKYMQYELRKRRIQHGQLNLFKSN